MEAIFERFDCMKRRTSDLLKTIKLRAHQEDILEEFYSQRHIFLLGPDFEVCFVARSEYTPADVERSINAELQRREVEKNEDMEWTIRNGLLKYECTQIQIRHFERRITELKRTEQAMLQNMAYIFRGEDLSVEEVAADADND